MAGEFDAPIARLLDKLRRQEAETTKTKELINALCEENDAPPMFADVGRASTPGVITPDRFYGQPLATAVRDILQMRKAAGLGAADTDAIYDVLKKGGFQFEGEDESAQKRGMAISLSKNSVAFHRVPSGAWGLLEWYPEAAAKLKKRRQTKSSEGGAEAPADAPETEPDESGGAS